MTIVKDQQEKDVRHSSNNPLISHTLKDDSSNRRSKSDAYNSNYNQMMFSETNKTRFKSKHNFNGIDLEDSMKNVIFEEGKESSMRPSRS